MESLIPFTTSGALVDCVDSAFHRFEVYIPFTELNLTHLLSVQRKGPSGAQRRPEAYRSPTFLRSVWYVLLSWIVTLVPQDLTTITANLVLEGTVERKHLAHYYADQAIGVMIIRGENVVLLGEIVRSRIRDTSQTNASLRIWMSKTKSLCSRSHWRS
jgi:hypothetical protein